MEIETFIKKLKQNAYDNLDVSSYVLDLQGWKDPRFDSVFTRYAKPGMTVIEVGTWKGLSTSVMASSGMCKHIIAVDTWLGAPEFWTRDDNDETRSLHPINGYPSVFYTFTKNMKKLGHDTVVCPFPVSSIQGAHVLEQLNVRADIIYIDAAHEYEQVYADIKAYWKLLKPGGVLMGDDYADYWIGVKQAVNQFAHENQINVVVEGVVWYIVKN